MTRPFVITIASEKGGVGKTTIATNLAVYLKALCEDLPVTIASFDNHFSVDQMFALGPRPERSVADIFTSNPFSGLVNLGQYGVQYIASSRRLQPPDQSPRWLRQRLLDSALSGVLILDTRPILDWFAEAALLAADLVIVPVKDRAALVNADALRRVLGDDGREDILWLLPSLVDTRARLNAQVRVHEFLIYAARERDYQVMDSWISKSPKVEGLASGFSSAIAPVLTHARNTAVHGQFKQLAEFVLQTREKKTAERDQVVASAGNSVRDGGGGLSQKRQLEDCPVCREPVTVEDGPFFFVMRSRRRGMLHARCHARLVEPLDSIDTDSRVGVVAITVDGPGVLAPVCRIGLHQCGREGTLLNSVQLTAEETDSLLEALAVMTGCAPDKAYRELILLADARGPATLGTGPNESAGFRRLRREVLRELRGAGVYGP